MAVQFFYDEQIRRFLLQFIRMTSNFQVRFGAPNTSTLQTVPVFYGDSSRQAQHIIRGMSENSLSTVPAMAVYITELKYDRERMQEPFHVSKLHIRQRRIDPDTGLPTNEQGESYTVERHMPVPYRLTLKLDIWTSNTEQKLQLIEQLCTLFNPSLEIQSTDNYIDWTSLSVVTLLDVAWDSRSVPVGTEEPISIATMTFDIPIWISMPAKLKKLGVVQKVVSSVFDSSNNGDPIGDPEALLTRRSYNPLRYGVLYTGNTLQLIRYDNAVQDPFDDSVSMTNEDLNTVNFTVYRSGTDTIPGKPDSWSGFLSLYGVLKNGTSEIRLLKPDGSEIVGTVAFHPVDDSLLLFEPFIDTLPANTLSAINAIIDPQKVNVDQLLIDSNTGNYKVSTGTRYLILKPINKFDNTEFAEAWTPNNIPFSANANDIIEYNGTNWQVRFDSQNNIDGHYVTNLNTGVQYYWDGEIWVRSYEGVYREGKWTLVI